MWDMNYTLAANHMLQWVIIHLIFFVNKTFYKRSHAGVGLGLEPGILGARSPSWNQLLPRGISKNDTFTFGHVCCC